MRTNTLVTKIWSYCDTLRDDGLGYGDYLEQLTYLLFLKMADEKENEYDLPKICNWKELLGLEKGELITQYEVILNTLGRSGGMLTKIFKNARNKIHDSFKLKKLILLINEENWTTSDSDIKGDIYESLLQKNAESSGSGQYFTPRAVIEAIVQCIDPKPNETISDPSCGTGGFFLSALEHISKNKLTKVQQQFLKFKTFKGWEIETSTARLCLMNLFLHGIGNLKDTPSIEVTDSLKNEVKEKVDIVLANPPFGRSSSDIPTMDIKLSEKDGYFLRKDFITTTSNKQLAFLQHIMTMINEKGRVAVVLPDNVLFEGGAGEIIRKKLLEEYNLHTILKLPNGIFYAQGVKSNVLFFDKQKPKTESIWFYDYRTNVRHTPKTNPLKYKDLQNFVNCYKLKDRNNTTEKWDEKNSIGRWREYKIDEILLRDDTNLDITWLKDDSLIDIENLSEPEILIDEIIENIENSLINFKAIRDSF
ncbi:N-6 DNA methylase [Arcobacter sp. YIC-80]|uniref:class I SAM-dependent DNA methyltransferase n=1 Tax=Arcobacter sp. YIC-80 TaxID=3376683 RepID=UPI003850698C